MTDGRIHTTELGMSITKIKYTERQAENSLGLHMEDRI
jgi:hypothetical protein